MYTLYFPSRIGDGVKWGGREEEEEAKKRATMTMGNETMCVCVCDSGASGKGGGGKEYSQLSGRKHAGEEKSCMHAAALQTGSHLFSVFLMHLPTVLFPPFMVQGEGTMVVVGQLAPGLLQQDKAVHDRLALARDMEDSGTHPLSGFLKIIFLVSNTLCVMCMVLRNGSSLCLAGEWTGI